MDNSMLKGVDVSKWQGFIDFSLLKNAVDFVIIRSSYGVGYTDTQYAHNKSAARQVGLARGYYHYGYPNLNGPEAEADYFSKVVSDLQKNEFLVLDFEQAYNGDKVAWCLRFLNRVSSHFNGYKPLIYLNYNLVQNNNWGSVIQANYGLWLAYWNYRTDGPTPPTPWPVVAFRQYSNKEQIAGISGVVDGDVFYGGFTELNKYGYQPPVVTPPQPPTPTPTPTPEPPQNPPEPPVPPAPTPTNPPEPTPTPTEPPVTPPVFHENNDWLSILERELLNRFGSNPTYNMMADTTTPPVQQPQTLADQVSKSLSFSTPVSIVLLAFNGVATYFWPNVPKEVIGDVIIVLMVVLFTLYTIFRFFAQKKT